MDDPDQLPLEGEQDDRGDYTEERREIFADLDLEDLLALLRRAKDEESR